MLHSFTRNYNDLSTDAGFQFEFYCDCCGNGVQSTFIPSTTYKKQTGARKFGRIASALGGMLGGAAGDIGYALERGSDAVGGRFEGQSPQWRKEYEKAFDAAQEEVRSCFLKCPQQMGLFRLLERGRGTLHRLRPQRGWLCRQGAQ